MPAKSKLDWFKLDCQLDDKIELIEAEFGLMGFAIVVRLWQKIYGGEGYYCEWNEDVALVFAKKNGVGANAVSEIVNAALKRGIFDQGMYKRHGILTSHGIQERYFEAVGRRKCEKIKNQYLLREHTQKSIIADNSSSNVNISALNADISSQNREDKNRIDKNRKDDISADKPQSSHSPDIQKTKRFIKPTFDEVKEYCAERKNNIDPQHFLDYYESNGWKVGKNAMKDWKAAIRTWERNEHGSRIDKNRNGFNGYTEEPEYSGFTYGIDVTKS